MNTRISRITAVLSVMLLAVVCNSATAPSGSARGRTDRSSIAVEAADPYVIADAEKTLTYLASDECEGRGVGTDGINRAADYIAARFGAFGLRKLPGRPNYFQTFMYNQGTTVDAKTELKLGGKSLERGKDYTPTGFSAEAGFSAPLVFVGYGITDPERNYDDFADVDVKGNIVVAMRFEPHTDKGKSRFSGTDDWSPHAALTT
ncbi:MAG: hypothetical protein ACREJC_03360, partial [Tepidisphaeraceae bacterium]